MSPSEDMSETISSPAPSAESLLGDIRAALQASQLSLATELARGGLDRGLIHPVFLHLRAQWFSDQARFEEALADLEGARELSPNDPRIHNGIGEFLIKTERFADSVAAFDRSLSLWPEFPLAHQNRGFALETLGEHRLAEQAYRHAAALDLNFADPLAGLAGLAASRGDWETARTLAARALAIDPLHAIANLVAAKADLARGDTVNAERHLQRVLDDPAKDPLERASATKQLGDVGDAEGRIAEAFAAYQDGNNQFRAFFAPRFEAKGAETTPDLVSRVSAHVAALPNVAPNELVADATGPAAGLVFLAGFPRSGTTLLGQILAAHPDVVTLEERFPIVEADRDFLRAPGGLERLEAAGEAELQRYRDSYWRYVQGFGVHVRDKVVVDKLPMHTFRLPLIARMFPAAKVVFALRDPRDVILSAFRRQFVIHPLTFELLDLSSAASLYDGMMGLRELCRDKLPLSWMDVRNEDMVNDFDARTQELCAFLGLRWTPVLRQFSAHARRQNIATPSAVQVRSGLSPDSVGQWRRYREHLAPVLPILQPWVEKFGYSAE